MTYDRQTSKIHHIVSLYVSALRRMVSDLTPEYATLAWLSSALTRLGNCTKYFHLVQNTPFLPQLDAIKYHQDRGALTTLHNAQVQMAAHLGRLLLPIGYSVGK